MNICFKGKKASQKIALTFDDGPHPLYTPKLLEILDLWKAKATFFMTGINARKNRSIVTDVLKLGHEIGNHSFSHKRALFSSPGAIHEEISSAKKILEDISGSHVYHYRPPYGIISPFTLFACRSLCQKIILWSVNSYDYRKSDYSVINDRLSKKVKSGSIVLFHDGHFANISSDYSNTSKVVENILRKIRSEKLEAVTVSDLLTEI